MRRTVFALPVLLFAAACSGSSASAPAGAAPSVVHVLPAASRASLSALFATTHEPVVAFATYTADTDPNHLLGRPNGYSAFTCWYDARTKTGGSGALGAQDGGCVETWPSQADAQARARYLQTVLKAMPMLGSEYDYPRSDGVLLRVSGLLTPAQATRYETVFTGASR